MLGNQADQKVFKGTRRELTSRLWHKKPFELRSTLCVSQEEGFKIVKESKRSRYGNVVKFNGDLFGAKIDKSLKSTTD